MSSLLETTVHKVRVSLLVLPLFVSENATAAGLSFMPDLFLHGGYERTTLVPPDDALGEPQVDGIYYGLLGHAYFLRLNSLYVGAGGGMFGFFQGADLEQSQFRKRETGTYDSSVYGLSVSAIGSLRYSNLFGQTFSICYDHGLSGSIKAKIGIFDFNESITGLSRFNFKTTLRTYLLTNYFVEIGAAYSMGNLTSESKTDMSLFSSEGKKSNIVKFSGYSGVIGLGWQFSSSVESKPPAFQSKLPTRNVPPRPVTPTKKP